MDLDGRSPYNFPTDPFVSSGFGGHLFSHFNSFADNSLSQHRYLHVPGSIALQEAFNCISKFAGALVLWLSSASSSNTGHHLSKHGSGTKLESCNASILVKQICGSRDILAGLHFKFKSNGQSVTPDFFSKISKLAARHFIREAKRLQSIPMLSLAAALIPPFDNISPAEFAIPLENVDTKMHGCLDQRPCEVAHSGCGDISFVDLKWSRNAVEPRTGILFPTILGKLVDGENNSTLTSEVLVGTGSRTIKVVRLKSLKIYAFGFYVHPFSVCKKLNSKYASIPDGELNKCQSFYADLLREDIGMTVRLVVNYNGMKMSSVKDAFEKSLRDRLLKMNPDTDFHCLTTFGSYFKQDIPLPAGTTVDFRRTADGQLITEIAGNQIGAVHSKDLCRAFFDMYIGDVPVSEQAKEEIGRNVVSMMKRC